MKPAASSGTDGAGMDGPAAPAARGGSARVALLTAAVAAGFLVVTGVRMWSSHEQHRAEAFLQPPELVAAREQLQRTPTDQALKERIRTTDLELRRRYFQHLDTNAAGAWLLVAGGVLVVVAGRMWARGWVRPILPGRAVTPTDEPILRAAQARWAVLGTAVAVTSGLLTWAATSRSRVPDSPEALAKLLAGSGAGGGVAAGPTEEEMLANWPRFRGPHGDGVATSTNAPLSWNGATGEGIVWKTPVPSPGFSSPVVWGNRVFLTGGSLQDRHVMCYDARSGELLWDKPVPPPPGGLPKDLEVPEYTGFAASTPATDGRNVYAVFLTGELAAFDFGGRLVWSKALGVPQNMYGHATSLLTWHGMLLVQFDQGEAEAGKSRLFALDGATGKVRWEQRRAVPSSWTTPLVIGTGTNAHIITLAEPWVMAYDAATGAERWRAECLGTDLAPSPVVAGDMLVVLSPGRAMTGIRLGGQGDVTKTHLAWQFDETVPDITSPVSDGALVYVISTPGLLVCVDAATGKKVWEKDLERNHNASPTLVGRHIYLIDMKGETLVVEAGRSFKEVAKAQLGDPVYASPAFVGDRMFVRGSKHLWCIGNKEVAK